jgi:AcrR family transcriptional regulator
MTKPRTTKESPPRARGSREQTTQRILDAAEALFAERNPADVTVREVAERAGVTHALVHQYVGSKDDLYNAVVQRAAPDRAAVIRDLRDFPAIMDALFPDVLDRELHSKTMIRSAMDGVEYTSLKERIVTGQLLIGSAREWSAGGAVRRPAPDAIDPRIVVAALIALAYGWVGIENWLLQICDLDAEDPAAVREQLMKIVGVMGDLALPAPEKPKRKKKKG